MVRSALALVLIFCTAGAFAEDRGRIVGHVVDAEGNGLPGVRVALAGDGPDTSTDGDGHFALTRVPAGLHVLVVAISSCYLHCLRTAPFSEVGQRCGLVVSSLQPLLIEAAPQ